MAMLPPRNALSTDRFSYDYKSRAFTAEASEIGWRPGQLPVVQLYDDAADVGIWLRSSRTGVNQPFYLEQTEKDREGGVVAWHFSPCDDKLVATVTVFND